VISTSPSFGATEPKGTTINIVASLGPKPIATATVPNVQGQRRSTAIAALKAAGFKVLVTAAQSSGTAANTVVNQSPVGGSKEPVGSTVTIGVTGATVTVPASVIGMSPSQATALLQGGPYNYTVTQQTGSGPGQVGTVYATSPPVGSALPPGSAIIIYVVGAPSPTPTPTPSSSSPSPTASP
jgi:eukaryotic-like serine/threonine-protein kinase